MKIDRKTPYKWLKLLKLAEQTGQYKPRKRKGPIPRLGSKYGGRIEATADPDDEE
jgi:hypothetical protein